MRKAMFSILPVAGFLTGCVVFAGPKKPDPLVGWGGVWVGEYQSEGGNVGTLEFEFSVDTAGRPLGIARFDTEGGPQEVRLTEPVLTPDSLKTAMEFDGLYSELRGARTPRGAEGVYVVWPESREEILDSGTWRVTALPHAVAGLRFRARRRLLTRRRVSHPPIEPLELLVEGV